MRSLRSAAGISLAQLADLSGIAKATLFKVEQRNTNPTLETISAIAGALGVEPTELLQPGPIDELEIIRRGEGLDI